MYNPNTVRMNVLSEEKLEAIYRQALTICEEIGFYVYHPEAIELLRAAGAVIEGDNHVKISATLIEKARATAPETITIYDQNLNPSLFLGSGEIYFSNVCDVMKYIDPYTNELLPMTSAHAAIMAKVGDACPNMAFLTMVGLLADYDVRLGSRMAFLTVAENTDKPINFIANDAASCKDIITLCQEMAGGEATLREKPFVFQYCEPIPPLTHDEQSLQKLLDCAEAGVPLVYLPYCLMGGTAPMTFAGALAQIYAEILCGLVIHQAKVPGAPFIAGAMPATIDMRTTVGTYGTAEMAMLVAASAELSKYCGLPFYGTGGTTDAKVLDEQTVVEATCNIMTSLLSPADAVHDVGFLGGATILSPELVVLGDEIISFLSAFRRGVSIDPDELALDVIREVGPGGNYLTLPHTFAHFRDVYYSPFMDHTKGYGVPSLGEKINTRTRRIIEEHDAPVKNERTQAALSTYREKWTHMFD